MNGNGVTMREEVANGVAVSLPAGVAEWEGSLPVEDFWQTPGGRSFRPSREIVHEIIERAVTAGYCLAAVPQTVQMPLSDEVLRRRREVAEWMDVNGVAVVGQTQGVQRVHGLRYMQKGGRRFVFVVPDVGEGRPPTRVRMTAWRHPVPASLVMLLGREEPLEWEGVPGGVDVSLPAEGLPCDFAWCLEIVQRTNSRAEEGQ